jgi:type IV pilus assembly protein PilE
MSMSIAGRRRVSHRTHAGSGFTVIEILVAVTIVGVLACIAVPSYNVYLVRSRLVDAALRLADHRTRMEQYYLDRRSYADVEGQCGVAPPAPSSSDVLDVGCVATATTYRVTVTGHGDSAMAGFAYATDETGARTTLSVPAGWTRATDCWTTRPDGSCL